eukprot:2480693-Amphidinium_carterae.1
MEDTIIIKVQPLWIFIKSTVSNPKGKAKGKNKGKFKGPPIKGKGKKNKGRSFNYKGGKGKQNQIQYNSDQHKGQQSSQGKGQWQQQNNNQNKGKSDETSIICWTCGKKGHTSNQWWWNRPVYQLDATDSSQPPVPLEPSPHTSMMDKLAGCEVLWHATSHTHAANKSSLLLYHCNHNYSKFNSEKI